MAAAAIHSGFQAADDAEAAEGATAVAPPPSSSSSSSAADGGGGGNSIGQKSSFRPAFLKRKSRPLKPELLRISNPRSQTRDEWLTLHESLPSVRTVCRC